MAPPALDRLPLVKSPAGPSPPGAMMRLNCPMPSAILSLAELGITVPRFRLCVWSYPLLAVWLCVALVLPAGAQTPAGEDRAAPDAGARDSQAEESAAASDDVSGELPPGVQPELLLPRTGPAAAAAQLSLPDIIAKLPHPDYLKPIPADAQQPLPEPPMAAQRAYLQAREALNNRQLFEARRQLETALKLVPQDPHLLRLMGRLWAMAGNRSRSVTYLQQALAADPADVETLYLLGRHSLEQSQWDEAAAIFHHLTQLDANLDADPAVRALAEFFLASALERRGNDAAYLDVMTAFLERPAAPGRSGDLARQYMIVERQRGLLWQSVGDARQRMGQPELARAAYQRAAEAGVPDLPDLIARQLYTAIKLNQIEQAEKILVEFLTSQPETNATAYRLVRYLAARGVARQRLAELLLPVYQQQDRSSRLAVAIAGLLGGEKGVDLLREHLHAKPADRIVFDQLLKQQLELSDGQQLEGKAALAAIRWTADAMEASPKRSDDYAKALLSVAPKAAALADLFPKLDAKDQTRPAVRYLQAMSLLHANRIADARAVLEKLVAEQPDFEAARLRLAIMLVAQQEFEKADELLKALPNQDDPAVVSLKVAVLARTGRLEQALTLLDELLAQDQRNVELVIQKATLQLQLQQPNAAERTLLDALQQLPREERIYELLFWMYDRPLVNDATKQYTQLMHRMLGNIPNSRLARLKLAEFQAAREPDQAEKMLLNLLAEDPADLRPLMQLLEIYRRGNRQAEAEKLLRTRLDADPANGTLWEVAAQHYQEVGDPAKEYEARRRQAELTEVPLLRGARLGMLHLAWHRFRQDEAALRKAIDALRQGLEQGGLDNPDLHARLQRLLGDALSKAGEQQAADEVFTNAIAQHPQMKADIQYGWAVTLEQRGQRERAEKLMQDVLKEFPDHASTNNGLGYQWANTGRNLLEAEKLIKVALEHEPNESAYLDSLGWVYYKLGNFPEAVSWLRRSVAADVQNYPVILDHLADALYRLGNTEEAMKYWAGAKQSLLNLRRNWYEAPDDPELEGLLERLEQKMDAVRTKQQPKLAPVPMLDQPAPAPAPEVHAADK